MRSKWVSVFSSPSSMRLRISFSSVRSHLSPAAAVRDAFSSGGNELRMASSTGCAEEDETNCGVCASARQNVREQKRNKQSVLPSLLGIGVSTGRAPRQTSAGFSLPPAHNTMRASRNFAQGFFLVRRRTHSLHACSVISPAAARRTVAVSSASLQLSSHPLSSRKTTMAASAVRLLPSRNGWFPSSPQAYAADRLATDAFFPYTARF